MYRHSEMLVPIQKSGVQSPKASSITKCI